MVRIKRMKWTWVALALGGVVGAPPVVAQFDEIEIPPQMDAFDFMIGTWDVEGAFRNPDHIGSDRTLWYTTRGGGVTRFDGRSWTAYGPGASDVADSVLASIDRRPEPYAFGNPMTVRRAQDGFVLIVDEGRTSGTTVIFYDTAHSRWVATAFHGPTNDVLRAEAPWSDAGPVFEGRGTDRRGTRIFRRRYEVRNADHFIIRTDVSFDDGTTWIDDQIVQHVRRR